MIIARMKSEKEGGEVEMILFGLSKVNIGKLLQGEPISISPKSHGQGCPVNLRFAIIYGDTEEEMEKELRRRGLIGPETVIDRVNKSQEGHAE